MPQEASGSLRMPLRKLFTMPQEASGRLRMHRAAWPQEGPQEASGGLRMHQDASGRFRRLQKAAGPCIFPWKMSYNNKRPDLVAVPRASGCLGRLQEASGSLRTPRDASGGLRRPQEASGGLRRPQKASGDLRRPQEASGSQSPQETPCQLLRDVSSHMHFLELQQSDPRGYNNKSHDLTPVNF